MDCEFTRNYRPLEVGGIPGSAGGSNFFLLKSLFEWAYQYGFMNLAQRVQHQLRTDAYNHLQTREIEFFRESPNGRDDGDAER